MREAELTSREFPRKPEDSSLAQRAAQLRQFGAEVHDFGFERGKATFDFGRKNERHGQGRSAQRASFWPD